MGDIVLYLRLPVNGSDYPGQTKTEENIYRITASYIA